MNTLQKTKHIMSKFGIVANKRFGQNFLIDDDVLQQIVDVSEIGPDDLVIEIGPGLGNLTEYILDRAGHAVLLEIDRKMINIINDRFKEKNNYTLINEDVLKVSLDELVEDVENKTGKNYKSVKVVANLPYYITTPIIFKLLEEASGLSSITVMVQKEVADRMVAHPKSKDYGILTIMVEYLSSASIEIIVPNSSFIPAPNVTSAVIKLDKKKRYKVDSEEVFFNLVHGAFAKRRKKLVNSLESVNFMNMSKEELNNVLVECNLGENVRAEELSIDEYIDMANRFSKAKV